VITVPERHGRTDERTDHILWHNCALRSIARQKENKYEFTIVRKLASGRYRVPLAVTAPVVGGRFVLPSVVCASEQHSM